jgi:hypothetical protein
MTDEPASSLLAKVPGGFLQRWSRPIAASLAALGVVVVVAAVGRAWLRDARSAVVVEAEVTEDLEQVFVNCQFVGTAAPGGPETASFDLGWLKPDDRISLAVVNLNGSSADVYFRGIIDGEEIFHPKKGSLAVPGISIRSRRKYVFERTYSADGDLIGGAGCQRSRFVALASGEYMRLADDSRASGVSERSDARLRPASFHPDHSMDPVDAIGGVGPWVLVAVGLLMMILLLVREWYRREWSYPEAIAVGLALIGALLALIGLVTPLLALAAVGLLFYLIGVAVLWRA